VAAVEYYGTGRRKTSTARVFLRPGSGAISVNHRTFEAFFPTEALRTQIRQPLMLTETADKFDILATVVVSFMADPKYLQLHFLTQKQAGFQPIFVSRVRAPKP